MTAATSSRVAASDAMWVYDVFNSDRELIYVGASRDVFSRLETHRSQSWWAVQIGRTRAQVLGSPEAAYAEERRRIRELAPKWNLRGLPPRETWDEQRYLNFLTAKECRLRWESTADPRRRDVQAAERYIGRVRFEFAHRFGHWPAPQLHLLEGISGCAS